jgi:predicted TIM-barrel fold metal-dependent hydrolase
MQHHHEVEGVIDPEIRIIDSHHHLADQPGHRYLLDELLADVSAGHNVVATVYVESKAMLRAEGPDKMKFVGETEFANGIAAMSASGAYGDAALCAAIVAFADLAIGGDVAEVLDAHQVAGGSRFRGIRQGSFWDAAPEVLSCVQRRPPRGLLADPAFRDGFSALAARDLTFDALVLHPQLEEVLDLARSFPDTRIVLNHTGVPVGIGPYRDRRAEVFDAWRGSMKRLSTAENVTVKLGGGGIAFWGFDFGSLAEQPDSTVLANAWAPYVQACIELFGVDRCMFESNAPSDSRSYGYVEGWNAMKTIVREYSPTEKSALFAGTANTVYRMGLKL